MVLSLVRLKAHFQRCQILAFPFLWGRYWSCLIFGSHRSVSGTGLVHTPGSGPKTALCAQSSMQDHASQSMGLPIEPEIWQHKSNVILPLPNFWTLGCPTEQMTWCWGPSLAHEPGVDHPCSRQLEKSSLFVQRLSILVFILVLREERDHAY